MRDIYTRQRQLAIYAGFHGAGCGQVPNFTIDERLVTEAERLAKASIAEDEMRLAYHRRILKAAVADRRLLRQVAKSNGSSSGATT